MADLSEKPIGVFDSGIGGLTVMRALMEHLPGENFVYLGDALCSAMRQRSWRP